MVIMVDEINPYEVVKSRYEKCVESNILSDLFNTDKKPDENIINDINKNKIAIYTAFTGDYDNLKDPQFVDENCDYICFTDNPDFESDFWEIRLMEDSTLDNNRKAKQYKVFPNKYLPDYKYSLWIDGSFKIVGSIREYINNFINSKMLVVVHPERDCIYEEANESIKFPRYSNYTINKQTENYASMGMPAHYGLPALGSIFREHNDPIIVDLMNQWWEEIIKYTNQDQLSFTYLMWKNNFQPSVSKVYCWINKYWIIEGQSHHKHEIDEYITSRNLIKSLEGNIKDTNTLTKEELLLLIHDIEALEDETLQQNIVRNNLDNQINDLKNSKSWKITSKLRRQ